ncbi:carboxypeptidase regulatory-like domain-containing protein [Bartonella krasnovii]|uniref:Carboxypeptidase regulatory-like domain-containing protein n=2 Tax=Bartonella krasnovii TaxID=2267275 RepID=A0ABY3VX92_9HYPH|nr:carboxypeptidase regulatory-like domain-containing protein [Bartonella krasnovii]UNF30002.1 carboxypeptidase regulatory-like domain-containing protein [Bartonella krasnovii]UNF36352.1 carboxypeptidase regulatory-like domain-containing protein [Bartonella krasnovii]UNF38035.1 carboxypeptidase regulatory-like domain-containing protein [Bartonella krasnovii]UNF39758.1 carboxypeptidase regulatory-like domain-containing protein [Bartonella krasnovii]UNF41436.1 carboxypeptidase regulatory-like do
MLVNNVKMASLIKIAHRCVQLCVVLTLLIWSHYAFCEEGVDQQQGSSRSFILKPQEQEKGSLESQAQLILNARLTNSRQDIEKGLVWRVYAPILGIDNKLPLVATHKGGSARFDLEPGSYLVHVSFGHMSAVRYIRLENGQSLVKNFYLEAGGLILNATLLNGEINEKELRFTIYEDEKENDDTGIILSNVKPQSVVRLKAGRYHVASHYGSINATVRSDIQVEAGKITEVTLEHQAAQIVLKLVRQEGGEALADTSWSLANDSGDIVYETVGAYVSLVLAEGEYIAIAKNKDKIYQKVFSVVSGHDEDISVVANEQNMQRIDEDMD